MKQKLLLLFVLFCLIFNTVSAFVWIYPGTDLISTGFTLNTRSAQNFTYVGVHEYHANLSWGGVVYHNVSYADRVGSSEPLVELGRGYQNAGSVYTTVLNIDYYAPAGWTTSSLVGRPILPYFLVCDVGWTDEITLPSTIWIYNESIAANDSIENFMQQAGVWEDFDMAIHYPSLTNYWKGHAGNTLHNITDTGTYYFKFFNATYIEIAYGLGRGAKITGWSSSQHNATHRRATVTYNPPNTIGVNRSWIGLYAGVTAYNSTLTYSGYRDFFQVFELFECKPPTNVRNIYNTTWLSVNMTWYPGNNTDSTVVVRNNLSYPDDPTDGYEVFNGTGKWHNETTVIDTRYYTVFGYNATFNCYSTGVDNPWGCVGMSCYNESNMAQAIDFDIEISNSDASVTYAETGCSNTHYLDFNDIPYGVGTIFVVKNETGYRQRILYKNLYANHFYNFTFYLPPFETQVPNGSGDDGGNVSATILCEITVIDELEQVIPAVDVTIKRYNNVTGTYVTIADEITDGYGQFTVWLIPNVDHYFELRCSGYTQVGARYWTPTPGDNSKIFRMEFNTTEFGNASHWWEVITLNCRRYTASNNLSIYFLDPSSGVVNVSFALWLRNYTSESYSRLWLNTTTSNQYWMNRSGLDPQAVYGITMHLNHTIFGYVVHTEQMFPADWGTGGNRSIVDSNTVDTMWTSVLGSHPWGWMNFLSVFVLIGCLFTFGQNGAGLSLLGTGFTFLFLTVVVGVFTISVVIPTLFVVFGLLVEWKNRQRVGG